MEFDIEWIKKVVSRHLPVFYLHHDDRYLPCSPEFFMSNSQLKARHPESGEVTVLAPLGVLSGSVLCQYQDEYPHHHLWMDLDPGARVGEPLESINDVPVLVHAKSILSRGGGSPPTVEAVEITYITLFAYNGHYDVLGGLIATGQHDGDIEHITARVDATTGELIAMWYNSHRCRDGQWVPASDVVRDTSMSNTTRPVAFIAKHGHGNYPQAGTVMRHFFFGNDLCSGDGPVWRPNKVVLLHPATTGKEESLHQLRSQGSRKLHCTPSRGSFHQHITHQIVDYVEIEGVKSSATTLPSPDSVLPLQIDDSSDSIEVVTDDPCEWVYFRGLWGETEAPICQSWYLGAETPVSRSALKRIFLHLWPETESI